MRRHRYLVIALASMTLLWQEMVWTRIFSAEFFYTYAFLVLSLALMGLGLGALTLRFFPSLSKTRVLPVILTLAAAAALAGPPLVFMLNLDFKELFNGWRTFGKLAAAVAVLSASYYFAGVALSALFRRNHADMPRLYMADLTGAGLGVVAAIALMNCIGTPQAAFLSAVPMLVAAFIAARGLMRLIPVAIMIAPFFLIPNAGDLLKAQRQERAPVSYTHWDAMAKIKVLNFSDDYHGLEIDNAANSPVIRFDGDWDNPEREDIQFGIDVANLIRRFDDCTFLSLGAGGGGDVLQALQYGASEVHAVEVIPHINHMMTAGELLEFSGRIYKDPRVIVAAEDARAYVGRFDDKFDVIYSLSSNSFAALASGSFALAENYLFTTEAFEDYWRALTDDGFMMMEHQFYMPRLVSSLIDALENLNVPSPRDHFAVYNLPRMRRNLLLLSKRPLTDEIRNNAFGELTEENREYIHLLYPAPAGLEDNLVNRIVLEGWRGVAPEASVDVSPSTDDRPFVGQMGLWRNVEWKKPDMRFSMDVFGYPFSKLIIFAILITVAVIALPLTLAPYLRKGPRLRAAPWLYFFLIGAAYMTVEVVLIQKYTLFVGPSVYSIAAILLTLLIMTGVGSRCSARINASLAFACLIAWLLVEIFLLGRVTAALDALSMPMRIVVAVLLTAPLGFFMGAPFPKGALRVGRLIDWGFAVNGVASVMGAAASVVFAMEFGVQNALLAGAALYFLAGLLIAKRKGWGDVAAA